MTKIMLVEDDRSLREIYGVRLLAEGYDIVSAGDGEEALAMAIKERPQLIVSDVMMPKISGFDMLDILRSTTETKNIKVIMMTALSSEEQRKRGESLGADSYLVKSQVGIEDVVRVVHEVLEDNAPPAQDSVEQPAAQPPTAPASPAVPPAQPAGPAPSRSTAPRPASQTARVIQPIGDPTTPAVDINALLDKELAREAGITDDARPEVKTIEQEQAQVEQMLNNFQPSVSAPADEPTPEQQTTPASPVMPTPSAPPPPPPPPAAPTVPPSAPAQQPVGPPNTPQAPPAAPPAQPPETPPAST